MKEESYGSAEKYVHGAGGHTQEVLRRMARLVDSNHDAIISKSLDGTIESWNRGARRIYGYTPEEAIGRNISMLLPDGVDDDVPRVLEKIRNGETVDHYETVRRTKDGRRLIVSLNVSPIYDEQGTLIGASAIARDITVEHKAREDLKHKTHALQERVKEQGCMYAISRAANEAESYEDIGRAVVAAIPPGFEYSDITHVRVRIDDLTETSPECRETEWRLSASIIVRGVRRGSIEVFYSEERPAADIGPFLAEEQNLLEAICSVVGQTCSRLDSRKRMEYTNRVLRAIRDVNQLIVRENDPAQLIRKGCEILVETRGFGAAWIALTDEDGHVVATAQAGFEAAGISELFQGLSRGRLPECCDHARRKGGAVVTPNPGHNCAMCPVREARHDAVAFTAALRSAGKLFGYLCIYVPAPFASEEEEISLVSEIASDLAFALQGVALVERREKMSVRQRVFTEVLWILNRHDKWPMLMRDVLNKLKQFTGVECIGLRLCEGDDFPYYHVDGFSDDFVKAENSLCGRYDDGDIVRDATGNAVLECMCGKVIRGHTDSSLPFFTEGGSFWTNRAAEASLKKTGLKFTRGRCRGDGYQSIALIPVRTARQTFGLLQFNDRREDLFTIDEIEFFERIAISLALAYTRMQAEQEAQTIRAKLEMALRSSDVGLWDWNMEEDVLFFSPEWKRQIGYEPDEIPNTYETWESRIHSVDKAGVLKALNDYREGRSKDYEVEFRFRHKDGSWRWILSRGEAIRDDDGKPIRMMGCHVDITERKEAEERLRKSEELLNQTGEMARVGGWEIDLETNTVLWTRTTKAIHEVPDEYLPTLKEAINFFAPEIRPDLTEAIRRAREEAVPFDMEMPFITAKGRRLWTHAIGRPEFRDGKCVRLHGVFQDITEQKRAEEHEQALEAQLRQSQKLESIGTLAGGVAHEINNPINGIMNYAELIKDRSRDADEKVVQFAGEIIHESERIAAIVKNLLSFSRQEKHEHSPARLADIVRDTLSLTQAIMRHDQIILGVDVPEDLPRVICRSQQIQQVLMNLITNARDTLNQKYPKGDNEKRVTISGRAIEKDGRSWVRATVEDNGLGIPDDVRERIFDPFYTTKPRDKGTGLGLSISHGIIREHGGELRVESEIDKYTRFIIDLPVAEKAAAEGIDES